MNSEQNVARRFEEERRDALNELQDLLAAAEKRGELTETDRKRKDELQRKLNYIELKTEHRRSSATATAGRARSRTATSSTSSATRTGARSNSH
jgi:predicted phage gp36 major capsid-like protein